MTASVKLGKYSEKIPTTFRTPDENVYIVKLDDWGEPVRSSYEDKETGEFPLRIQLKFKIVKDIEGDDEFADCDVSQWVNLDLNPNDKKSIWHPLSALDPANDPEPDMELDTYRGKSCKANVEHSKPKANANGVMTVYANVAKTMPLKKNKPAPAPKTNPLLAEDDE